MAVWKSGYRLGVRERTGLAFWLLAGALFGLTGWLSADAARRQAEADAAAALQGLAERLALQLDADMAARLQQIGQLAAWSVHFSTPSAPDAWQARFESLQRATPYSWIGLASPAGEVLASTGGLLQGRSVAQRPWFQQGARGPMVGDVHEAVLLASLLPPLDSGEPRRFVDVAAPVREADGRLQAVIGAHLSWEWAEARRREALARVPAGRQGVNIVLVDRAGKTLLGPPATPSYGPMPHGVQVWSGADGQRHLAAASPSLPREDYPGMGWVVVVRQPLSLALAAAEDLQRRVWLLGLLGATLFGIGGWWLAGRLTEPLRDLARQAQASGAGVSAADEVQQLAASLGSLLTRLQSANDTLESRVVERTESLQRANEDLREFTRSVSHDLRGPLASIAMVLRQTLTQHSSLEPPVRHTLEVVATEAERLRHLSEELLTLAMVEQRDLVSEKVAHQALVREVLHGLPVTAAAQVEVGPLPELSGDALMLRQVWVNLLSNALKFSARVQAPCVQVHAQPQGQEIVFSVHDNGAGFDPAQSARLFGVFQRLHPPSQFPGTGVGLSIVRRVVHRHGGRVWAESRPGQGATFFFALPQAGPPAVDQAASASPC